jgi:hypothetical protein
MTVLALTWVGYIKIIGGAILAGAGAIGVIGTALGYLKDWLHSARSLAQRLWRVLRHTWVRQAAGDDEARRERILTVGQVRVLNAVHQYFLKRGKPAPFWELDKLLDRRGILLRKYAESLPRGLLTPDVSHRGGFHSDDELMVTIDGLRYCENGMATLDLLARVLAFMAKREKAFMPTPTQRHPEVHAAEIQQALGLSPVELKRARILVEQLEPQSWEHAWSYKDEGWSFTLVPEGVRCFRGVQDGAEYLLARAGIQSFAHRLDEAVHDG